MIFQSKNIVIIKNNYIHIYVKCLELERRDKTLTIDQKNVKISIWDTMGMERYGSVTGSYLKDSNAFIVVFDMSNRKSFVNLS